MRIAIDGFELDGNFTGVGRYLENLLEGILRLDEKNSYTLFKRGKTNNFKKNNLKLISLPSSESHTKWQNRKLLKALNKDNFDLFFSPNHTIPLLYKGRSFMTIHDVSWRGIPGDFSIKEKLSRDIRTRISIGKCEKIFTDSEFSKVETEHYYPRSKEKIIPIHLGIEEKFHRESNENISAFKDKYKLSGYTTIGFLGSMFKRRHIPDLIRSFFHLRKNFKVKLFLVGKIFDSEIKKYFPETDIIHIDRIDESEIRSFYSSMDIFTYFSEYEGFGFPPLESLMCGTIPLLLKSSSLKEIFDNTAVFIQNPEHNSITKKITDIILNRENYSVKIFKNFEKRKVYFSWDRVAENYLTHFLK